jgi:UDP-GlcNAc:undecaprenyl-phosphate GlcNAc-1-phosphate transferase
MTTYFALFLTATFASVTLTPLVRRACERLGWLDVPGDGRRVHRRAVPRLGGVAVCAAVFVALAALAGVDNAVTRALDASRWQLFATLAPAALVFLFGVYDDLRGTNARAKFAALGAAAALFYALGGRVEVLSVPWVGVVELPPAAAFVVTLVWVIGIANAFNLIDGLDGLAAGAALFASLVMLLVALMLGQTTVAVVACVLCGALVGFLRYNFNPASIFLGDSGALFIGFILAALSVNGAQKASTAVAVAIPLLAFGVPVVDTGFTLVRRFLGRRPLFVGDREHIHHMMLERGWSQRRVAFVLYGASAVFGLTALFFVSEAGRATGFLLFVIAACVVLGVGRLRYHEVDELRAGLRRNLSERRVRAANHIRVRRASRRMSEAATPEELFAAVRELLEPGDFVYARVQLEGGGARDPAHTWEWGHRDFDPALVRASGRCWTLRLPLTTERGAWGYVNLYRGYDAGPLPLNINYLCDLFQSETARAAERILTDLRESENDERGVLNDELVVSRQSSVVS